MSRRKILAGSAVTALILALSLQRQQVPTDRAPEIPPERPSLARGAAAIPSPAPSPAPLREDEPLPPVDLATADGDPHPFQSSSTVLPNGLELVIVEDHSAPQIAAQVVFRVGAAHDPPGQRGAAHLLEHLMFHGTRRLGTTDWAQESPYYDEMRELTSELVRAEDRRPIEEDLALAHHEADQYGIPGELHRLMDALGATDVNASTSLDSTRYVATLPPEKLLPWAVTMAEQLSDPVLRAFVNEREVVHRELELRNTSCTQTWESVREALFDGHPYGPPIGGTPDDLASIDIASLEALFERSYGPGNAAVILVGDLDPYAARQVIEDTFGRWQPRSAWGVPELPEAAPVPTLRRLSGGRERHTLVGWQLGELDSEEDQALQVLASALRQHVSDAKAVLYAQVHRLRLRHGSMLVVDGYCREEGACEREILKAVRELQGQGVTQGRIEAVRARAWVEHLKELERPSIQASELADGWVRGVSGRDLWLRLVGLRSVTKEQVQELAQRLDTGRHVVQEPGKREKKSTSSRNKAVTTEIDGREVSAFYEDVLALPVPEAPSRWRTAEDFTVADGGRVIAVHNPANTLFQATLSWEHGWGDDPALCLALQRWDRWLRDESGLARWGVRAWAECEHARAAVQVEGPGEVALASLGRVLGALSSGKLGKSLGHAYFARLQMLREHDRLHLLHGPLPFPTLQTLKKRSEAELLSSVRALLTSPPRLWYSGPGSASDLAHVSPGVPRPLRPALPLVPEPRSFLRWLPRERDMRSPILAARVGEPYDPAREALYAVYDRWLQGLATDHTRLKDASSYAQEARYQRGRFPGEPNVTLVEGWSQSEQLAERMLDGLTTTSTLERFERAWQNVEESAWSGHVHFRDAPAEIASWFAHELPADRQQLVWEGLPSVTRETFRAFVQRELEEPVRMSSRQPLELDKLRPRLEIRDERAP